MDCDTANGVIIMTVRICRWLSFVLMCVAAQCLMATDFESPPLDGFPLHDERDADGDGDGINETHIQHYLNPNGNSIFSMTTG